MSELPKKTRTHKGITLKMGTYQLLVRSKSILQVATGEQMTWDTFFKKLIETVPQYQITVKAEDEENEKTT